MAAYFQLYPKGSKIPATFISVDEAICKHFGVEPDDKRYYESWYDTIGFALACGRSYDWMRENFREKDGTFGDYAVLQQIIDYMEMHYDHDAWMGR